MFLQILLFVYRILLFCHFFNTLINQRWVSTKCITNLNEQATFKWWIFTCWWWSMGLPNNSTTCTHKSSGTDTRKEILIILGNWQETTHVYATTLWAYTWSYEMFCMWGILCYLTMRFGSKLWKYANIFHTWRQEKQWTQIRGG